jgi:MFS family permease
VNNRTSRAAWAFAAGIILVAVMNGFAEPNLSVWWPDIQRKLGIDDGTMGIVGSGIAAGLAVGAALAGWVKPRLGWTATILIGAVLYFPLLVLVPLPDFWVGTLLANLLWGLGNGMVDATWAPAASRYEQRAASGRRSMLGFAALKELSSAVAVVAAGAALEASVGILSHLGTVGVIMLAIAVAGILLARPAMRTEPEPAAETNQIVGPAAVPADLIKRVRLLKLLAMAAAIPLGAMFIWSAQLLDRLGIPGGWIATGLFWFVLMRAAILEIARRWSARVEASTWVKGGGVVAVLGSLLVGGAVFGWPIPVVVGMALVGGGLAAASVMAQSVAGQITRQARVAAAKVDAAVSGVVVVNHIAIWTGPAVVGGLSLLVDRLVGVLSPALGRIGLAVAMPMVMLGCTAAVVALSRKALAVRPSPS